MTEPMSHDELSEMVAVYALDAVDDDEARLIEEHLSVCPRCRAELAEHREVTALLAFTGAPAPEGLWDRISASLDDPPSSDELGELLPLRRDDDQRGGRGRWGEGSVVRRFGLVAAAAAVLVALLGAQVIRQDQELDTLRAQMQERLVDPAVADPDATLVDLSSADGSTRVQALVDRSGRGYLLAHNLPALAADQTYQLWGVSAKGQPISLGVLGRDPATAIFHLSGGIGSLAITAEEAPGVVVSQENPVVAGEVEPERA